MLLPTQAKVQRYELIERPSIVYECSLVVSFRLKSQGAELTTVLLQVHGNERRNTRNTDEWAQSTSTRKDAIGDVDARSQAEVEGCIVHTTDCFASGAGIGG